MKWSIKYDRDNIEPVKLNPQWACDLCLHKKRRIEELEPIIRTDGRAIKHYCEYILNGPMPGMSEEDLVKAFYKFPEDAARYCVNVLKKRMPCLEEIILSNGCAIWDYMYLCGNLAEFPEVLEKYKNVETLLDYVPPKIVKKSREIILDICKKADNFRPLLSRNFIEERWSELEQCLIGREDDSLKYCAILWIDVPMLTSMIMNEHKMARHTILTLGIKNDSLVTKARLTPEESMYYVNEHGYTKECLPSILTDIDLVTELMIKFPEEYSPEIQVVLEGDPMAMYYISTLVKKEFWPAGSPQEKVIMEDDYWKFLYLLMKHLNGLEVPRELIFDEWTYVYMYAKYVLHGPWTGPPARNIDILDDLEYTGDVSVYIPGLKKNERKRVHEYGQELYYCSIYEKFLPDLSCIIIPEEAIKLMLEIVPTYLYPDKLTNKLFYLDNYREGLSWRNEELIYDSYKNRQEILKNSLMEYEIYLCLPEDPKESDEDDDPFYEYFGPKDVFYIHDEIKYYESYDNLVDEN